MRILSLIQRLRKDGIDLSLSSNDSLEINFDKEELPSVVLKEIIDNKADIIAFLKRFDAVSGLPAILPRPRPEKIPLSFSQERLWFIDTLEGSLQYHLPFILRLKGELDCQMLEKAFMTIVNRHEVLRTVIGEEDGLAYQRILDKDGWKLGSAEGFVYLDEASLRVKIEQLVTAPFNLSSDYMLRGDLIKAGTEETEYVLIGTMHHIISDGWSIPILVQELTELYNAFTTDRPFQLPELPVQYADYAIWQRQYLSGQVLKNKMDYWRKQLSGVQVLNLPTDYTRPPVRGSKGASAGFHLDKELTGRLERISLDNGATLYMTLLSAFNILLYKYSGQEDICVGSPIAGRQMQEVERLIGFFINTLVLRNQVSQEMTFRELLLQVRNTTLEAYAHQDVPFEKVVEALVKERDMSRSPLFDVMFVLQNNTHADSLENGLSGLSVLFEESPDNTSKFDLSVTLQEYPDGISGLITYSSDLYDRDTIERMLAHYESLLQSVVADQNQPVGQLDMITEPERQELLYHFNDTKADYPKDKTIVDLFYEQAARTPDNIALVFGEQELTYRQLDEQSNQLGHYLRSKGVREESMVVICLERSLEMIIGILGIMKAGGAYVPIDPDYPQDRIAYMIEDTAAKIALTAGAVQLPPSEDMLVVNINTQHPDIDKQSKRKVNTKLLPSNLAYVIYTSGSTGRPKGVMIEHKSITGLFGSTAPLYHFCDSDVWSMFHSFCFDFSVWEIFGALFYGGRLIIISKDAVIDNILFADLLINHKITILNQTPSAFYILQNYIQEKRDFLSLKYVIFGGEALSPNKIHYPKELSASCQLVNMYGITEISVHATYQRILLSHIYNLNIPIGRPISNTQIYILNKEGKLSPIGVGGEICIGGAGVARGYLNRPELTSEKFINNPFSSQADARIYRTGDLGRWLPDGNIEFLGRIDDQVKIRGYRIEPGEIESALAQTGRVQQAVVLAKEDSQGNKRLIGYVVPGNDYQSEAVLNYLGEKLPEYMVPGLLIELDAIPLTPNGKTDRKALLEIDLQGAARQQYEAPRNPLEEQLAAIWSDLLGLEQIGIHDNFFSLGGHSLLAMRMVSAIRKQFDVEIPISHVFNYPTILQLAGQFEAQTEVIVLPSITSIGTRPEKIPLSFSQERLWFIDTLEGSLQYHLPFILRLKGELDCQMLEKAFMTIVNRHEVLRTVIGEEDGLAYQRILDKDGWKLGSAEGFVYLDEASLRVKIEQLVTAPFNLSSDYMLRGDLIKAGTEETEYVLIGTMHHIISDGWSIPILVQELTELYNAFTTDRPFQLPELPVQYADYAIWQRQYLSGQVLKNKMDYWRKQLSGVQVLNLPTDYTRPPVRGSKGASAGFHLDKELTGRLERISLDNGATLYMTLLSAFNILLYKYSGQEDICVGSPIAGRQMQEVERLIGFFINTLVLRNQVSQEMTFRELLLQVRNTTLEAYAHQDVPFEKVVEALVKERDMSRSPLFDVIFVLQNNTHADSLENGLSGLSVLFEESPDNTSKFDLSVTLQEYPDGISGLITYSSDLYDRDTIERMLAHYESLLQSVVADQNQPVGQLDMITEPERQELLYHFNDTKADYPKDKTIVDLFYEQAARTPDNIALVFGEQELTYRQLDEQSNQLGHYLRSKGVREESMVVICLERSLEMLIGILGIMKAGGAYVPIDPDYPQDRIAYMIEDTAAKIALTAGAVQLPPSEDMLVVNINTQHPDIDKQSKRKVNTKLLPSNLAYVIYTSGSTGRPKGVMIEHGNVVNLLTSISNKVEFTSSSSFISVTTYSFDICYLELYTPLIHGGNLVIVSREEASNGFRLKEKLTRYLPTHMQGTPSTWQILADAGWKNEEHVKLLVGGESIQENIKIYLTTIGDVWNVYGPTETTIWSTLKKLVLAEKITIGRPISNTQIYILNKEGKLSPIGVGGEICIGGAGLARGYLNRSDLTSEKFINNPFSSEADARIYRTGDLGRWLPDGNIEFLGRIDDQVKIRGYRIEPGEIESALAQTGRVQQAVVLAKEDSQGNKRLIGYVVPGNDYQSEAVLNYLGEKLPEYMVPGLLIELDAIPLTPNGKTDRKALLEIDLQGAARQQYEAPRNPLEEQLAAIWSDLLGLEQIGIHDNFFSLGGHSLLAMRMVSAIRKQFDVEIPISHVFNYPTILQLAGQFEAQTEVIVLPSITSIGTRPEKIPLSFSQERLWFIDTLEGSLQYHLPFILRLKGELDCQMLEKAFMTIVNRHEVLRTVIGEEDGLAYQRILDKDGWKLGSAEGFVYLDEASLRVKIEQLVTAPFNLSSDYMLRGDLIKAGTEETEYVLIGTMHHIISDGWSIPILVQELTELYNAFTTDRPFQLPELPVQYADYAIWQRQYLSGQVLKNKMDYWRKQLSGVQVLNLPTDYTRPPVRGSKGASAGFHLDKELTGRLERISLDNGATLYMTLLSAFNILLYKYSGQEDICVGSPIAGRQMQEVERLIGFFINTLVLRNQVSQEMTFRELLLQVRNTTLEAYAHQDVPFEKVVEALVKERDMSRSPLFDVMFVLQNNTHADSLENGLSGLSVLFEESPDNTSKFDLSVTLQEYPDGISGLITYSSDLYDRDTIERMLAHYESLLQSVVADQNQPVGQLDMITEPERQELLYHFNDTKADYPKDKTIVDLFYEQAARTPDNIALVFGEQELTYRQLDEQSNQLGHYLRSKGVREESMVVICLERSLEMIIGILGIMKAGGAYVPIDPDYPQDRIAYMIEDTAAKIALTAGAVQLPPSEDMLVVNINTQHPDIDKQSKRKVNTKLLPSNLAYVIYTSGSTGRPKGVMIEHKGLGQFFAHIYSQYLDAPSVVMAFTASYAFDISIFQLLMPLLSGGKSIVVSKEQLSNIAEFASILKQASVIDTVPAVYDLLVNYIIKNNLSSSFKSIKKVFIGGDVIPDKLLSAVSAVFSVADIIVAYGPTETTIFCTNLVHSRGTFTLECKGATIGRPISNTQIYILNKEGKLSPIGVGGEICIGGAGVARGYLNRPELTSEKFINNPFSSEADARIYRTGDLGRWLPDGNIEFLGRIDDQVKIRGYRIEPGEIESALAQTGRVQQAVVLAKEDSQGNKRLIGYVVPGNDYQSEAVLNYLGEKLPEYMVPGLLIELDAIPLTPNGKTDRKALLEIDLQGAARQQYEAPRNPLEEQLAAIWSDLLGLEQIGIHDNFFSLGGHSLLAMRMVSAIRKQFDVEIPISHVFNYPTILQLAGQFEAQTEVIVLPSITSIGTRPEKIPLSFSQERLWFIDTLEGSLQYHLPFILRLKGELDCQMLEKAFMTIVNRHEVLRTVIGEEDGLAYQRILDKDGWKLGSAEGFVYLDEASLRVKIEQLVTAPFNLSSDYMLRGDLIKAGTEETEYVLIGTMHHIISDGWSIPILVQELTELYNAFTTDRPFQLPELPVQYADYAIWQRQYLSGQVLKNKMDYWRKQLSGVQVLNLPTDYTRPPVRGSKGASAGFHLDKELTGRLERISLDNGATLYMTLLSAFNILLYKYSGQEDICVGSPIAGRQMQEVERLIGFFINTLVLRNQVSQEMTFRELLLQVRNTTLEAYAHQDVPFEKVVEALVKERDMSRSPLFDVKFALHNLPETGNLDLGSKVELIVEAPPQALAQIDVSMDIHSSTDGLEVMITYSSDLYDRDTIERMLAHYESLLQSVVADQNQPVGQLDMITEPERQELLYHFNDTKADYPKDKTIVDLFYEQAARTPDNIALVFGEQELTYRQLDEQSNQLGHYLRSKGVREESMVVICLERSLEMLIGILGIMKAGGAYVPIDPDYPQDRIAYMIEDTAAKIALTAGAVQLPPSEDMLVVNINTQHPDIDKQSKRKVNTKLLPSNLAYVIYTSGSTGWPKGVMIEHGGLINMVLSHIDLLMLRPNYRILQFASFSFDGSCQEIFNTLSSGCTLILISSTQILSVELLEEVINKNKIDIATLPPSYQSILQYKNLSLQTLYSAGEILNRDLALNIQQKGIKLINGYGPTENTVTATLSISPLLKSNIVTIGRPISNTQIYILNKEGKLSPIGVGGEICIGGAGLARGYLNRSDLTSEKFINNPFSSEADARIYRTGDLGRWLPDGNIEFLGRIDDQVKIRGYRIEPGEIESALAQTGRVQQAVVLAKEDSQGNKRLIGYVVPGNDYQSEAVLNYLGEKLPEYMVPGLLIELDAIPLTPNGKTDRKALLEIDLQGAARQQYEAPRNPLEEQLAAIWSDLLGLEQIGIHDNFFNLGGDSIITIQMVSRLRHAGYVTRPRDIFMHQSIAPLAAMISAQNNTNVAAEQGVLTGKSGLLPIQKWFLNRKGGQLSHYNQSVLLGIDKSIGVEVLQQAVQLLSERHDALRFRYKQNSSGWEQYYLSESVLPIMVEDLVIDAKLFDLTIKNISDTHQRGLDIYKGELIRVVLMKTLNDQSHNRLLIVIHHLVVDGVSWRILLQDMDLILIALMKGKSPVLSNKSSSYREWHDGLVEYGKSGRLLAQREYWYKAVQRYSPLPYDHAYSGPRKIKDAGHYRTHLSQDLTQVLLHEVPGVYHTEINDILLAALAKTIVEWSGSEEIVIGLEGHGREDILEGIDLTHTMGWFTCVYPVLVSKGTKSSPADWIKGVKEQLRKVPDRGLGYGILKDINKDPQLQGDSPWDIVFNYLGQLDNVLNQGNYLIPAGEPTGEQIDPELAADEKLSINSMVVGRELVLNWGYSTLHFSQERIQELADRYLGNLEILITHCTEQHKAGTVFTPSDYGLGNEVSYEELDSFLQENTIREHEVIAGLYRLSDLQQGMLFHGLYEEGSGSYVEQLGCELIHVDVEQFINSWAHLIRRHSILRSSFEYDTFKVPVQCVYNEAVMQVDVLDYREKNGPEQAQAITDYEAADRRRGFDFKTAPLMRVSLLRLSEDRYYMLWSHHHIILDGWSCSLLMGEFLTVYENLVKGTELPEMREDKYEDYIRYIENRDKHKDEQYWLSYLKGVEGSSLLPFIATKTERNKGLGQYKAALLFLDEDKTTEITAYTQSHKITINTLIQGVWSYLLHQYTGNPHITYGVTVSGRPDDFPGVEDSIGLYINTLPLHSMIGENMEITEWLQSIQQQQLESREYQYNGLNTIQGWAGIQGDLFDTVLVFENYPVSKVISSREWMLGAANLKVNEQGNYPLGITIGAGSSISILFNYNVDLIEEIYIEQLQGHFERVLQQIMQGTATKVGQLDMITEPERQELLYHFNDTKADYPKDKTIVDLFYEQAARTPDNIALVFGEQELTYRQLDEQSNQLGHYLRSKGVREESMVVICLERSLEMLIGILGIMKAGGAYVPIDPEYPADRINYMLEDTGGKVIVSSGSQVSVLPQEEGLTVIELDTDWHAISREPVSNISSGLRPSNLAYVIYTSGSTGRPKGVMIEHGGLMNRLLWAQDYYRLTSKDSVLQKTSFCFDVSVWEFLWPLLVGSRLVIAKPGGHKESAYLRSVINDQKITMIHFVPSMLMTFLSDLEAEECQSLSKVLCSGEELKKAHAELFTKQLPHAELHNLYGPTEASIDVTHWSLPDQKAVPDFIPIGRPISNTQIYILNKEGKLSPIGVGGEICIGGAGVARGYLNRPELTSEKFINNPFSSEADARIYRTGDLGRWLPDGNIEFLGRIDDQVKIRGYRIEPGEIESALAQTGRVQQAVVLAKEDSQGNKRLIGYVVPGNDYQSEAVLNYLGEKLPEYMVPGLLIELDAIPLTPNGKTDRKALLEIDLQGAARQQYEAPRNPLEEQLAAIWSDLLGLEQIGIHDNFFNLGGDSIITIQMVSRLRHAGYVTRPRDIFMHQSIAPLAAMISAQNNTNVAAEQGVLTGKSGLLPIQKWFLNRKGGQLSHYNQSVLLGIDKSIGVEVLQQAVQLLSERHDALRFRYKQNSSGWEQYYLSESVLPIMVEDLVIDAKLFDLTIKNISDTHQRGLDIYKGELIRVVLMKTLNDQSHNRLLIVIHHLVVDGVSWRILLQDMDLILIALMKGKSPVLSNKSSSYREWHDGLVEYGKSGRLLAQREYWYKAVQRYSPLPYDHAYSGPRKIKDAGHYRTHLSQDLTQVLLHEVPGVYHTEINDILLAALAKTIVEWSGSEEIVIGLEGHGREDILEGIDLTHTMGWFTCVYPVLVSKGTKSSPADWIKGVKEQLRKVPDRGLGYGILKDINKDPQLQGDSPWDIVFNYLGQLDNVLNQGNYLIPAGEPTGEQIDPELAADEKLSINSMVVGRELVLNWGYSTLHFSQERIQELADRYLGNLEILITHCTEQHKAGTVFTPSDYGLGNEVSYEELDSFLQENPEDDTIIDL